MRIAFLTVGDPGRLTGGYLYHRELFARLRAQGHSVDELSASGAALAEQLAAAPAFVARFDPTPYDVLLVDALARGVCGPGLDRWRATRPLVAMVHELPSVAGGAENGVELAREAPLLRADRLIAVSDDGAAILVGRGVPAERITVASGGYDRLAPAGRGSPDELNREGREEHEAGERTSQRSAPRSLTALCVAQWIPRKGVLELARAWAAVAPPGWRLELVGENAVEPGYRDAVLAALTAAPVGSVAVRGPLSDTELATVYSSAALFAMPSRYEGYGIAFAEAMAFGLPVLGCAVGPVPALVGGGGLLVPPGDQAALTAALARLLADEGLRAELARAALARAAALPSWDDCAARVLAALVAARSS